MHNIDDLLERWQLTHRRHESDEATAQAAAAAVARGEIVGWFQDRAELGPRALGSRSILCHPGLPGMKDRLNARVKFREPFRPFAASVLTEYADKWFDLPAPASPFMLLVCPVWPAQQQTISEVVHVDGTCRVQTVNPDVATPFRVLLEAFERETGLPLVLNTSFNLRGMPIVERPEEAIDCLYGSRLDRIFIGEVEIPAPDLAALRPARAPGHAHISSVRPRGAIPSAAAEPARVSQDCSRSRSVDGPYAYLLNDADGARTLRSIAAGLGLDCDTALDTALELRRHGLIYWDGIPQIRPPALPLPQYDPQRASE